MQDFAYFKSLYPAACKQMQLCVEAVCDELEYEGSPIYDEYPDRIFLEKLTKRALEKWQKVYPAGTERMDTLTTYIKAADVGTVSTEEGTAMVENSLKIDSPGGEREENLAGTSIQPHLPGNDVWYGPLRGEQKGGNAGYMVWEADEPNLTAQERRPWSPPPGPRPGGPGNPWGSIARLIARRTCTSAVKSLPIFTPSSRTVSGTAGRLNPRLSTVSQFKRLNSGTDWSA